MTAFAPLVSTPLSAAATATGTAHTGGSYFVGILVSAYSGGPQTIVARDSTDASGRILARHG